MFKKALSLTAEEQELLKLGQAAEDFVIRILNKKDGYCQKRGWQAKANNRGLDPKDKYKIDLEIVNEKTGEHVMYIEVKINTPFLDSRCKHAVYYFYNKDHRNSFWNAKEPNGKHCSYVYVDVASGNLLLMTDEVQILKMLDPNDLSQCPASYSLYNAKTKKPIGKNYKVTDLEHDFMYIKTLRLDEGIWQEIIDVKEELKVARELRPWLKNYDFQY